MLLKLNTCSLGLGRKSCYYLVTKIFYLDGHSVERVDSYKCLSMQVDQMLSWGRHMSEVNQRVSKVLAALRRFEPLCPSPVLITIYKSLILPHFDFCSAVWGALTLA